ncbi:MAG: radical SAM protein [Bacteroidales bacterium]|jgi:wyosine [tRNA(Phe)-imidazoG37] synthetase (radical SAM superfamily)|nr:radical SAM protein [Bacteroidales bacterium]
MTAPENIIFGPVPSRRLGKSLGVNNIPAKSCSYSCKYCQLGLTNSMEINRKPFYLPGEIAALVRKKLLSLSNQDYPDYISIVPDGEPTLDKNLGELIQRLSVFGLPVAVFTNSSLLSDEKVRQDLVKADFVSLKVDAVRELSWRKINRPHKDLSLKDILQGIRNFTDVFHGILATETMMLRYLNDSFDELDGVAAFVREIGPETAYIAVPTRPPAVGSTKAADESSVMLAYHIFQKHGINTELLTGYEGNAFASGGNFQEDMLSITAVHPLRCDAVNLLMRKSKASEEELHGLVEKGLLIKVYFNHNEYYLPKFLRE